jgi:tellurite resistance protein TehA-like permease
VIGAQAAIALDAVLWTAGTALGLWTAAAIPYRTFTQHEAHADSAFGGWLMPIVPPMVSAATGPLLIPYLPAGQARLTLVLACYAMFGLTAVSGFVVTTQIWSRLAHHSVGSAVMVPTLWIVLGFLGQSITASHQLGEQADRLLPAPYGLGLQAFAVVYGMPVWGFAMLWVAVVGAITLRTARQGLPFSLTWWSFTFPVGTVVTGTSALAGETGAVLLSAAAIVLFVGLVAAWSVVVTRTAHGVWSGALLRG